MSEKKPDATGDDAAPAGENPLESGIETKAVGGSTGAKPGSTDQSGSSLDGSTDQNA
jgi:hypothetical protein